MIREPDPGNVRGREPTASDRPDDGDETPATPTLQLAPEPVVDLRDPQAPVVSPSGGGEHAPGHDRRSVDPPSVDARSVDPRSDATSASSTDGSVEDPGRTGAPEAAPVVRRSGLADRAIVILAAPLVVLVVTLVAAAGLLVAARSAAGTEADLSRAAVARLETRVAVDELDAAVLATVAAGIGQSVTSPEELARRSGTARSAVEGAAVVDPAVGGAASTAADAAAIEFIDAVDDAVERTGGDPLDLGNELSTLDDLHLAASSTASAAVDDLDASAADARAAATLRTATGVGVVVLGLLLTVVLVWYSRRRLSRQLDRPVRGLRGAVAGIGNDRTITTPVLQGPEELVVLGAEIDAAARTMADRLGVLERRAAWGERSRMILEALELADDEPEAYEVIGEALAIVGERHRGELLLAERGSARLTSVAANAHAGAPGCPVEVTTSCVALRRGQVSIFDSSETINACPKLRDRPDGPCSAVCVPVTVAGRQLGVLHVTGSEGTPPGAEVVEQVVTLSSLVGNRLGSLRTLESSRQEASTDGLTGLPNRRTLEAEVAELIEASTPFVMVLADLDKFKRLNDNFGHEVGDKALQLFAGVLRDNVRGNDVVARLGGEEFVLVYPNMSVEISVEAIDRLRQALARAVGASRIPPFTCSFGVAHSTVGGDGDVILRVADAGLLRAKELGGDRAVVADEELAADVFADDQD